jgi:hypothetical protein
MLRVCCNAAVADALPRDQDPLEDLKRVIERFSNVDRSEGGSDEEQAEADEEVGNCSAFRLLHRGLC